MDKITAKHSRSQRIPLIILAGIVVMIIIAALSSQSPKTSSPDSPRPPIVTTNMTPESLLATPDSPEKTDVTQDIKALLTDDLSSLVKDAVISEPGRIQVETSIVDPRGKNGSPQAEQAISICNTIVKEGYKYIAIMENDGTHYVVFGHSAYPAGQCSEI